MKSIVTVLVLLLLGIARVCMGSRRFRGKGKSPGREQTLRPVPQGGRKPGKPMEMVAGTNNDAYLKEAITDPKKTLGPQVKMPAIQVKRCRTAGRHRVSSVHCETLRVVTGCIRSFSIDLEPLHEWA